MAGRPRNFDEDELIKRAISVFWQKGYAAASAKDLMTALEIGQGSFYLTFKGGKKELYIKSLIKLWNYNDNIFNTGVAKSENPLEFIRTFFLSITEKSESDLKKGCFTGNTLVESAYIDEELQELAIKLLKGSEKSLKNALVLAQDLGILAQDKSPKILASFLINLWNGINLTVRMGVEKETLKEMVEINMKVLE